jgi:hypothetical protein
VTRNDDNNNLAIMANLIVAEIWVADTERDRYATETADVTIFTSSYILKIKKLEK